MQFAATHTIQVHHDEESKELDNLLRTFWEIDQLGEESAGFLNEGKCCEDSLMNTHRRLSTEKYIFKSYQY